MVEGGTLVREAALKPPFSVEVLELRFKDQSLSGPSVREAVGVFEQQQSDHKAARDPRSVLVILERSNLVIEPAPSDLTRLLRQLLLHIDELLQP